MMFGTKEVFDYFLCDACGTMQIAEIPENLGQYYSGSAYYSFNNDAQSPLLKRLLRKLAIVGMIGQPTKYPHGKGPLNHIRRSAEPWIALVPGLHKQSSILDVGCGEGARLGMLAELGFKSLHGADPFLPDAKIGRTKQGVHLERAPLADVEGQFDLITMHHALEHFPAPDEMLRLARDRLAPGGHILVRIPVLQREIWEEYGPAWAQFDPPRHLYLFAASAFVAMAERQGLHCVVQGFDGLAWSQAWSEAYGKGIPMFSQDGKPNALPFDASRMAFFEDKARRLNAEGKGDSAYFVLKF